MKVWSLIILLTVWMVLVSCGYEETNSQGYADVSPPKDTPSDMTGFVMKQQKDRLLVVHWDESDTDRKSRAMWVSDPPKGNWLGKQVEVWIQGEVLESYPEQGKAQSISVLEMSEVDGAEMEASEALRKVLKKTKDEELYALKMLVYDKKNDQWTVRLMSLSDSREIEEKVSD
ncbi:YobA family protein [Halobacillus yeomjeoni]|uniref:DUF3221 domain-containing protein n=1 Tax=Halobacillus yeomjeoni TaxID=311194 RepID=UPI001CD205CF|nr:DUF3221 domain-containing protein [Halobacillus yeomjeoni]MCA0984774.1 YobA family protein [Halobacillus yeomjeoni]